jgi:CRP-like cAMP-binding protein
MLRSRTNIHAEIRQDIEHAHTVEAQAEIVPFGAPLDRPRLVLTGWVARVRDLKDSRRQILSLYVPGDVFGFSPCPGATALGAYIAITSATVAPLRSFVSAFHAPAAENASLAAAAWAAIAAEDVHVVHQILRIGRLSAYERLAHFLLEMEERLDAAGLVQDGTFHLSLTQEMLGDTLGLSIVHTNRVLQQLRRERLIETRGSNVRLLERHRLAEICDWPLAPPAEPRTL